MSIVIALNNIAARSEDDGVDYDAMLAYTEVLNEMLDLNRENFARHLSDLMTFGSAELVLVMPDA